MTIPFWRAVWNCAQRAIKDCLPFDSAIPLLGLYPKEMIGKMTCTKIFIAALFVVAKKMENKGMPFNWGKAKQIVAYVGDGILLCSKNNELEKFLVNWKDLQELMQNERSRTRRTLYTETDPLWYNQT